MKTQMSKIVEILLIEDSPSDANLIIKGFNQSNVKGFNQDRIPNNLHWIEDGETAMEYLYQQDEYASVPRPDLILLDLNLPGMDGREVLAAVKSDPSLKLIPVVILTTSADEHDVLRSYNLNANCYVTKPLDVHQFIQVVELISTFWVAAVRLPTD
jgi:CheY-like chemotaxis protein